jgi:hypothetical protein
MSSSYAGEARLVPRRPAEKTDDEAVSQGHLKIMSAADAEADDVSLFRELPNFLSHQIVWVFI